MNPKRDFIGKPAPPGYVAGVGRGATGFTTRSDIGPAREAIAAAAAAASGSDEGPSRKVARRANEEEEEEEYLNESNYDEFAGYRGSLFNKDPYEEDDEEADRIYEEIDKHLDERGKALREAKTRQELERYRQERPKIQQQFSDLKANLRQVSEIEWMNIPDVGDARNRKQRVARQDKFTPVPDSLLAHQARLATGGEKLVYIDPKTADIDPSAMNADEEDNSEPEEEASLAVDGRSVNIGEMSEFRSSYMSMKLSRISNPVDNQTTANPQDYLTNLQSMVPSQITDASTLKEYRKQFASLRASNPTFPNAWIASVRLEEAAGKLKAARLLILEACEQCPKSPDLWCEAVRLQPPDMGRALMVKALKENPRSVKLWIKAADIESDETGKRKVYAKAREIVPKSVLLWKKSVELEGPEEAKVILREAVECCPEAVELWLALARLEPYERAQQVLIKASEKNPTERGIWIMAAKLEEAAGNKSLAGNIIQRAIEQLSENKIEIKRDEWLMEAIDADKADFKVTCREILRRIIGWNIGDISKEDKLKLWLSDAQKFAANKSINCARAVFESIVGEKDFCRKESVWLEFASFERQHGTRKWLEDVLRAAIKVENCIESESLWLMLAEERKEELDETRRILSDALDANPDSEKIIFAAVELECENGNYKEARRILADACMSAKTAQLVLKSAKLEWALGNLDEACRMLRAGVQEYRDFGEFYLMLGQIEEQRGDNDKAKAHYSDGLKFNPTSVPLWISLASLEERTGFVAKARSKLELARLRNPKVVRLWLEAARLEMRAYLAKRDKEKEKERGGGRSIGSRPDIVTTILAKGIKECRGSPELDLLYAEQAAVNKRKFV